MSIQINELLDRYQTFTKKSLQWCIQESEASTARVSDAIDMLLQNTSRVSVISEESILAIEGLHSKIQVHLQNRGSSSLKELIDTLRNIAQEHDEIHNVIHPIIQSLQFQDRLRQNLENISAMIPYWLGIREQYKDGITDSELREVGLTLMKKTTMSSERDVIREKISGLPEDEKTEPVLMF